MTEHSDHAAGNDFWGFSNGTTIAGARDEKAGGYGGNGGGGFGRGLELDFGGEKGGYGNGNGGVPPLSPLPQAKRAGGKEKGEFKGFKLFPAPGR